MPFRTPRLRTAAIAGALAAALIPVAAPLAQDLPEGEGRAVVQTACTNCHGVDVITAQRRDADTWREVVARMVGNGAILDDAQYEAVVKYLTAQLGPAAPTAPAKAASGAGVGAR